MRIASAISVGLACWSAGTRAPVTIPPCPTIWWQPAQLSVNSLKPSESEPFDGSARGIGGAPSGRGVGARERRAAKGADVGDQGVDVRAREGGLLAQRLGLRLVERHAAGREVEV